MEDIPQEPTNTYTIRIDIEGLTPESAKVIGQQFISWLNCEGAQDFWMSCEQNGEVAEHTVFKYNIHENEFTPWVVIEEYTPEQDE